MLPRVTERIKDPIFWASVVLSIAFVVLGVVFPFLTLEDGVTPRLNPALTSAFTAVGSLLAGVLLSSVVGDGKLKKDLQAERDRGITAINQINQQHSDDLAALRKNVCGVAGMATATVWAVDNAAQQALEQTSDGAVAAKYIRDQVRVMTLSVSSSMGSIFNTFGIKYKDGLVDVGVTTLDGMHAIKRNELRIQEDLVRAVTGGDQSELSVPEALTTIPPKSVRISVTCPRCSRTINGVNGRLLTENVMCFCPACDASIQISMPSRTPHIVGVLTRADPATITGRQRNRAVLQCPTCHHSYATITSTQKRLFALCQQDAYLLVVTRRQFSEWREDRGHRSEEELVDSPQLESDVKVEVDPRHPVEPPVPDILTNEGGGAPTITGDRS